MTVSVRTYSDTLSTQYDVLGLTDGGISAKTFDVVFPSNDTSLLIIRLVCGGLAETIKQFYVCQGNEAVFHDTDPRPLSAYLNPVDLDSLSKAHGTKPWGQHLKEAPDPAYPHGRPFPDDGSVVFSSLTSEQRDSLKIAKMRELERTPLTDSDWERITVGGVKWSRRQGDSLFREPLYYDKLHDSAVRAKMAAFDARTEHEICLDLSDTADYRMVTSMLGSGSPSSKLGFLIFTATKDQINELSSLGFGIMYLEYNPSMRPEMSDSSAVSHPTNR